MIGITTWLGKQRVGYTHFGTAKEAAEFVKARRAENKPFEEYGRFVYAVDASDHVDEKGRTSPQVVEYIARRAGLKPVSAI